MMRLWRPLTATLFLIAPLFQIGSLGARGFAAGESGAGLAMRAEAKYPPGFKAFDYVNPQAPKGGSLILGEDGGVDTRNPFALKGEGSFEVEKLVFQELGESSLDEPFTRYPSLAESFAIAPDHLSLVVKIRPEAVFSDHHPVTAADVVFSFELFRSDKVLPFYKSYWSDIKQAQALDAKTVKFTFAKENPELALIITELPILPKHVYEKGEFADQAIGSGPYVLKELRPGAAVVLARQPDWWGKDLAINKGRYNFDEIQVKYYKDPTALGEAFKKGDFTVFQVASAKVWATDLTGDKFDTLHYIKRELLTDSNAQGGQGFVFNLRLPLFQDVRVRRALALAFDFDWSNKNLFFNQYQQSESFFQNTPLAAHGLPSAEELAILTPLKADLPAEVFTKEMGWLGRGQAIKERLREAAGLLQQAGYKVKDGVAEGPGGKLAFRILLGGGGFQRVIEPYLQNLRKIGVQVSIDEKEASVFTKRLESRAFDMTSVIFSQSQSPGNEQRDFWGSAAAQQNYSRNYSGLSNKAVDALVDRVIYAKTRAELELSTRCLDRVLYHSHLMVQNWFSPAHRLAYWDKYGHPQVLPLYYSLRQFFSLMWYDPARAAQLSEAQAKGLPLR